MGNCALANKLRESLQRSYVMELAAVVGAVAVIWGAIGIAWYISNWRNETRQGRTTGRRP